MRARRIGLAALLGGALGGPALAGAAPGPAPGPAPGLYESAQCETSAAPDGTPRHQRRRLQVGAEGSSWQLTLYADTACTQPVLQVRGRTQAEVLGPARAIPGAVAVRVRFLDRHALAHTPAMARLLAEAGCGRGPWVAGVEQAIGQTACLGMPPIEACPFDHDVLRVDGDRLYTGQRDGDGTLCTAERQPRTLDPAPLQRR